MISSPDKHLFGAIHTLFFAYEIENITKIVKFQEPFQRNLSGEIGVGQSVHLVYTICFIFFPTRKAMMKSLLVLVFFCCLAVSSLADSPSATQVISAEDFDLADLQGKVVLLDFWASWCKPCQESMPWLTDMQKKHGTAGLQVVAVNLDQKLDAAAALMAVLDENVIAVHDPQGKLAEKFQLEGMPSAYLFGPDGKLAAAHVGFLKSEAEKREKELMDLLPKGSGNEN